MSNEIMSLNPALAEVTYRRDQLLRDAAHVRMLRTAKAAKAAKAVSTANVDRTANESRTGPSRRARLLDRFLAPGRRIVAARGAPVRQAGPTPLWR